jgi:D-alanyl-lipoteichoic acid acyltransferase DltB (MBOAT superfamily)
MLFNSLQFAVFFLVVFGLYLCLRHKWQNRMLLVASCIFYGAWDWRFLFLMLISIGTDYFCSLRISQSESGRKRKSLLLLSIFVNFTILGFFKYFNFFINNLEALLAHLGFAANPHLLKIVLPVGISFYTFQSVSYTFDVYRKGLAPAKSFLDYALFIAFFPQLVAGPIMKARNLLPQIISPRRVSLEKCYEGCYFILWGLFQKIFVADNLAKVVDQVFSASPPYNGAQILIALYAFAFQIYCDFAGYSNMARGLGAFMGFEIMVNFNLPYFATSPSDFWKRWHISLSSWLRDYLYIPLGGNRKGGFLTYRNLIITMLIGGLWHGAAWTFVLWGAYHGILLIVHRILGPHFANVFVDRATRSLLSKVIKPLKILLFFNLTCLGWLLFRAHSMTQVFQMLGGLFLNFHIEGVNWMIFQVVSYVCFLLIIEFIQYTRNDLKFMLRASTPAKLAFYYICMFLLIFYGAETGRRFIYFQF